jgi:hypothetical protein
MATVPNLATELEAHAVAFPAPALVLQEQVIAVSDNIYAVFNDNVKPPIRIANPEQQVLEPNQTLTYSREPWPWEAVSGQLEFHFYIPHIRKDAAWAEAFDIFARDTAVDSVNLESNRAGCCGFATITPQSRD